MPRTRKKQSRFSVALKVLGAVFFSIAIMGLLIRLFDLGRDDKVREIEVSLQQLKASLNADSIRQYNIQKIMRIVEMYNPEMPSNERYDIASEIYNMSVKYRNLDVDLICATITHESAGTWDAEIVSSAGAMGLMQIMPATGMFVAYYESITWTSPEEILFDPIYNIRIGCRYLSTQIDYYDVDGGLAAYNGGAKWASLWVESGRDDDVLPEETRQYLPAVMALYNEFQELKL